MSAPTTSPPTRQPPGTSSGLAPSTGTASSSTPASSSVPGTSSTQSPYKHLSQAFPPANPSPDYLVDMEPPDPKTMGRWRIRRFADAEEEFKQAHSTDPKAKLTWGIISYAWGPWHDKSDKVLGGVCATALNNRANDTSLVQQAGYPNFDIGVSKAASETGADLSNTVFPTSAATQKRNIPPGTPLTWIFPYLRPRDGTDKTPPFTIDQVYYALKQLGQRYVWWDVACFPQGYDWDPWKRVARGPEFQVHAELRDDQNRAFNNLRYFYPNSTTGCLWWHQSIWDPTLVPAKLTTLNVKKDPQKPKPTINEFPIIDIDKLKPQDGIGNRDFNAVQRVLNSLLDMIDKDPDVQNMTPVTLIGNTTHGAVYQLINNLSNARAFETSLRSLWSFQEGVLFTSSRRPLLSLTQSPGSPDKNPSVILDRNGTDFTLPGDVSGMKAVFKNGNLNLIDITYICSLIAATLADGLISRAYAPTDARYWQGKVPASVPNYSITFEKWCTDKANDGPARLLLSRLLNTGLVGYSYDSPLTLLEAKFGRVWEAWQSDMDVNINTIMGCLDVDFKNQLDIGAAIADAVKRSTDNAVKGNEMCLEYARPEFVKAILDLYQWRMLYLARGDDFKRPGELGFTVPFWDRIIGKDRPPFAPLNVYLIGRDQELADVYGPNRLVEWNRPSDKDPIKPAPTDGRVVDFIPKLSIPNTKVLAICAEASPQYTFYEFPADTPLKGWTDAWCYQYVKPGAVLGEITPAATVESIAWNFAERWRLLPATGDIALLPIKEHVVVEGIRTKAQIEAEKDPNLMVSPARSRAQAAKQPAQVPCAVVKNLNVDPTRVGDWTTCAILVKYEKAAQPSNPPSGNPSVSVAVFWGIGDFKGLGSWSGGATKLVGNIMMY